jgi:hypothetical protein
MPSHWSTIGFDVNSLDEFDKLVREVGPHSKEIKVENGFYYHWHDVSGAELWIQINQDQKLIGMNPHFAGQSQVRVAITREIKRPRQSLLDGAVYGWADSSIDDPESGAFPFVFDLPNYRMHQLSFPSLVDAQIAAFAHEISLFDSVEAYNEMGENKLAPQSFIPSGLFAPKGETPRPPHAYAIITGKIVTAEEKSNSLTGRNFFWASVDTFGGSFDIVTDPVLVSNVPRVGGILQGSFWLSGTIADVY